MTAVEIRFLVAFLLALAVAVALTAAVYEPEGEDGDE